MKWSSGEVRRWSRVVHRELSFFLTGMLLIYAISGIALNHRDTFNPDYSVERATFRIAPFEGRMDRAAVEAMLAELKIADGYVKHYNPDAGHLKIFLKEGATLTVTTADGTAVYEKLHRRPLLSALTRLHFNPGRWWRWFSDFFAAGLVIVILTGCLMLKGPKGIWGRGGLELLAGMLLPLLFFLFLI